MLSDLSKALSSLSAAEREALKIEVSRRITDAVSGRFIDTLYPDSGPLGRDAYPKHMEFFAAGQRHDERAFVAGNRCLTPWTAIETDRGERRCVELLGEEEIGVRSWDGGSLRKMRASSLFLKGIEPAFRVRLDNGQFFDCSRKHRVLTVGGWLSLGRLMLSADARRWIRTHAGCPANYGEDDRRYGLQPRSATDTGQAPPRRRDDARSPRPIEFRQTDEEGRKSQRSHAWQAAGRLPILDDPDLLAGLFGRFSDPGERRGALSSIDGRRDDAQSPLGSSHHSSDLGANRDQSAGALSRFLVHPLHVPLFGCQRIISIEAIGCQPIIDIEVPGTHNYRAGGVIHHNTGKTTCVCYETTLHLIGVYPPWWNGRRFDRPITAWAAGVDTKAVRESLQPKLLGPADARGTGIIPRDAIIRAPARGGVPDAVDFVEIKHKQGTSRLLFKAYEQGRESFQSTEVDVILLDEEPPLPIYTEALTRTIATVPGRRNGCVLCSFTPLSGVSETVLQFLPGGGFPESAEDRLAAWGW